MLGDCVRLHSIYPLMGKRPRIVKRSQLEPRADLPCVGARSACVWGSVRRIDWVGLPWANEPGSTCQVAVLWEGYNWE